MDMNQQHGRGLRKAAKEAHAHAHGIQRLDLIPRSHVEAVTSQRMIAIYLMLPSMVSEQRLWLHLVRLIKGLSSERRMGGQ